MNSTLRRSVYSVDESFQQDASLHCVGGVPRITIIWAGNTYVSIMSILKHGVWVTHHVSICTVRHTPRFLKAIWGTHHVLQNLLPSERYVLIFAENNLLLFYQWILPRAIPALYMRHCFGIGNMSHVACSGCWSCSLRGRDSWTLTNTRVSSST